jgi:hypothetical protein
MVGLPLALCYIAPATMTLKISGSCHYHPARPGIGVCVECRQVICQECTTQFEGINRCAACLTKMSKKREVVSRGSELGAGSMLTLLFVFGVLFGGVAWAASLIVP